MAKHNCADCKCQDNCLNPRYRKFREGKQPHNCPAFWGKTRKEKLQKGIKKWFNNLFK